MSTVITASHIERELELLGQTVVVIGGSSGIGLETAGCNPSRLVDEFSRSMQNSGRRFG